MAVGHGDTPREREVEQEIETFLAALESYPERAVRDPYLSFEQYLFSVVATNQMATVAHHDGE
jgi:hypothetical protein